jgi:hypothetical protein
MYSAAFVLRLLLAVCATELVESVVTGGAASWLVGPALWAAILLWAPAFRRDVLRLVRELVRP